MNLKLLQHEFLIEGFYGVFDIRFFFGGQVNFGETPLSDHFGYEELFMKCGLEALVDEFIFPALKHIDIIKKEFYGTLVSRQSQSILRLTDHIESCEYQVELRL